MMSPGMELFSVIFAKLSTLYPGQIYQGGMPGKVPYPFIYLGEPQEMSDFRTKGSSFGQVSIQITVWHNNLREQGKLDSLLFSIRQKVGSIEQTPSYGWCLSAASMDRMRDTTTGQPLSRGILNLEYKYYRRKNDWI